MGSNNGPLESEAEIVERLRSELAKAEPSRRRRITEKFLFAALGAIPWVGGFIAAAAEYKFESDINPDSVRTQWLEEHQRQLEELYETLEQIQKRFDSLGSEIEERIQSEEYLSLVRKAFRAWDNAESNRKRSFVANVITNAAGTRICSDDVVRLFIEWLDKYHEMHFSVIREVFDNPGSTKYEIWTNLYGQIPREDSADADLYKLLIRDLSTGGVIRQARDTNEFGQFVRKTPVRSRRASTPATLESAFEDSKPHVLTELGKQFVHYTMNDVVARLE